MLKVAVITPFHNDSEPWLRQAQQSVRQQIYPCQHILVGDAPLITPLSTGLLLTLPINVGDFGDTPRGLGSLYAAGLGFDAVAYLDADNWYHPDHIASLVDIHQRTGAGIVTSGRNLHRLDGSYMAACGTSDGTQFADTNSLFITRAAFRVLDQWILMDPRFHAIGDRVIWQHILTHGYHRAHSQRATLAYRTGFGDDYRRLGEALPPGVKSNQAIVTALAAWQNAGNAPFSIRWSAHEYAPPPSSPPRL